METRKVVPIEERIPILRKRRKQRANRLFIVYLFIFFLLIIAILYFQSPYSSVGDIQINGNLHVSAEEVLQLSGITENTKIWRIDLKQVEEQISEHVEISEATVSRKFPNHIEIDIVEYMRIAYLIEGSQAYPILETGQIIDQKVDPAANPADAPLLINWENGDVLQEMAAQLEQIPVSILNLISEIHYEPTEMEPLHITVYMNDGFHVSGTIRDFAKKISSYPQIVNNIPEDVKGTIDLEVGYFFTPFENDRSEEEDENEESER